MSKSDSKSKPVVHRYIDISQVDPLRDAAHDRPLRYDSLGRRLRDEALVVVLMDFGIRVDEARQLKQSHFRLDEGELFMPADIQKDYPMENVSPGPAHLRIDPQGHFGTVRLLRTYFNSEWYQNRDSEYVFPSRQSDQMTTESMRNVVRDLAVYADITIYRTDGEPADPSEFHPHACRHSLANYMLADESVRLIDVTNRLRHRTTTTTEQIYNHFQRR